VKSGVPVEEILASLYEAVVYQNIATLTKGNTPQPGVLLLGGPNLFFNGLLEAWRHHLGKLWKERRIDADPATAIQVPKEALYYACLGCIEIGGGEQAAVGVYAGREKMQWWIEKGQWEAKARDGAKGLVRDEADMCEFVQQYGSDQCPLPKSDQPKDAPVLVGCDFGSTMTSSWSSCQRIATWPGVLPYFAPTARRTGSSARRPVAIGEWPLSTMSLPKMTSFSRSWRSSGWYSIWLVKAPNSMSPVMSRNSVPLIAGPVWTRTPVPSGRPGTVTSKMPDFPAPTVPVKVTGITGKAPAIVP